jgi:hypothetical protein
MRIVGDYRYSAACVGDQRYAIIRNGDAVERIRRIEPTGNLVIWETGRPLTDEAFDALAAERGDHSQSITDI